MCSGSNVHKETLVKTVERNLLEHRARHSDRMKGRRGSVASPSKPGPTTVANTAAPHQTAEGRRTYTPLVQQRECGDLDEESLVQTVVSYPLVEHRARRSSDDEVRTLLVKRLAAAEERSTICQAEMRRRQANHQEEIRALMAPLPRKREIEADAVARLDAIQTQIDARLAAAATLPNDEQVAQLAAAAAPPTPNRAALERFGLVHEHKNT